MMRSFTGMLAVVMGLWGPVSACSGFPSAFQAGGAAGRLSARWLGQDGHDYVGPNNRLEPSEVQDLHILLTGLDPGREITFVDVTAQGGDQWHYNAQSFAWKAELKREKGASKADLFIEPGRTEPGRAFQIVIRYGDGATETLRLHGRRANPRLRMPEATLAVKWMGQDRQDRVGAGPSVGPDGVQDLRLHLSGVSVKVPVKAMRIEAPGGLRWESGANPDLHPTAEFWSDPKSPGQGDLFFQSERDLKGQRLKVAVLYANDLIDSATVVAGGSKPGLRVPESAPLRLTEKSVTAKWLGQDGRDVTGPGDVHVVVGGMGRTSSVVGAVLTDSVRGTWVYQANDRVKLGVEPWAVTGPLGLSPGTERNSIELFFAPYRDETGANFTLRLIEQDGRMTVGRFHGGACDPGRRAPLPATTRIEAKPGDDLNTLTNQYGTVVLGPGTYRLTRPLVLNRPVTLTSEGGATLLFTQGGGEPPWTAAIKIHSGHTTLNGFSVRFEGPIRWDQEVSYGPAVIGTTDARDQGHNDLKVNLALTRLDLEIPAATDPSKWVEALRLMRLTNARGGMIAGNVLRGGPIEFFDGPWKIVNNDCRGTVPGTFSHGVFAGHHTHDLLVKGNRVKPVDPSGKIWRFLVLTHGGSGDLVEDNVIEQIGEREGDTIPRSNEPEIILTESYQLSYEGRVVALSPDGRMLRVGRLQGQPPLTGDVVSLLTGPAAGQWRRIAQVIDHNVCLLDAPIPKGTEAVSISRGFVGETFQNNRIDIRGSRTSEHLILVGNHFGTRIVNNHLIGGARAFRCTACPTESPVAWGWSHAPFLGGVIEGNIIEDTEKGAELGLEHSAKDVKANKGRTYMTVTLNHNVVRWSEPFLNQLARSGAKGHPPGITLGYRPSHDPGELVVSAKGNRLEAPPSLKPGASLIIHAADYNKKRILNRNFTLPRGAATEPGRPQAAGSRDNESRR